MPQPFALPENLATRPAPDPVPADTVASAVLVALLDDDGGESNDGNTPAFPPAFPKVILTERAAHLRHHAGQISFPGGRMEPGETPRDAALREAEEEVGLAPDAVEVIGYLPGVVTGLGFHIAPVLARVRGQYTPRADPGEVARILPEPLAPLLDRANHMPVTAERGGRVWQGWQIRHPREYIWGATALLIVQWARLLYPHGGTRGGETDSTGGSSA